MTSTVPGALAAGDIFPDTIQTTASNRLSIGGCDTVQLAEEFGIPLHIFEEHGIESPATASRRALESATRATRP
jgi:hypothetical protein